MEPQEFSFKGQEIRPDVIEKIWENTKNYLAQQGYFVQDIKMPDIVGITLTLERLRDAFRILNSSPHIINTSKIEFNGEYVDEGSACVFRSDEPNQWNILVWEKARPIRNEIKHEILHIWESILGLEWGTLTQNKIVIVKRNLNDNEE
jgi:hypothetical protein